MKKTYISFKTDKASLFNAAKISFGCAVSIVISMIFGLKYSVTAGLITVLSIQSTKKETAEIAVKRLIAFFTAVLISYICFRLLGYTTAGFSVYLFIFVLTCGSFRAQSAIVPVSVLITHILSEKKFTPELVFNEFMLLLTGAGIGFILNLYLHKDSRKMAENRLAVDNEIKAILGRMSDRILVSDKSDYNGECFNRLDGYMQAARSIAVYNRQNTLFRNDNYDLLYLDMREKQCVTLREMYKAVKEMDAAPEQVHIISALLRKISDEYHEKNNVHDLITETDRIITEMKSQKMPETRSEFENRAVLYTLLIKTREFLSVKYLFMKSGNSSIDTK